MPEGTLMDQATAAVVAPWAQLGIVGSVVLALGVVCIFLWRELMGSRRDHMADVKACGVQTLDITVKKIESDNKLADALEGLERVIETALRTKS